MAACLTMSGQQINQRLNDYRSNEILTKQRVDIDVVALLSRNEEWNLEDAEFSKKRYKACYYFDHRDLITGT